MPIDWSKYGVNTDSPPSKPAVKTSVDFSKYLLTPEPSYDFQQLASEGKVPPLNPANSELGKQAALFAAQQQEAAPQPEQSAPDTAPESSQRFQTDLPGGILNPVNDINRFRNTKVGNFLDEAAQSAGRMFGLTPEQMSPAASTGNNFADKTANILGSIAGYATNPTQLEAGIGQTFFENPLIQQAGSKAENLVNSGLAKLTGSNVSNTLEGKLLSKAAQGATVGALGSAAYAPLQTLLSGGQVSDIPGQVVEQGLGGAALGGAFGAVGAAAGVGLNALADKYAGTKIGDALSRLIGRNAQITPESERATQQTLNNYTNQYKNPIGPQTADDIQSQIMQEVSQRMTPPLENPKLLDRYLVQHLGGDIPTSEINSLRYNDKAELAQHIRDTLSVHDIASQVAAERGYNWNDLIGNKPQEAVSPEVPQETTLPNVQNDTVSAPASPSVTPVETSRQPLKAAQTPPKVMDERGHTATVRTSDMTPEPLKQVFSEPELYKTRSTQKLFDDAQKFIKKNGQQGAYDFVMNARKMTDRHNAVAQILSKQLANSGDISRAIDVVSKTAQSGTELGRAIQALSLWNRMDTEGALLLAQRQLNKNAIGGEYRILTPEQAKPVIAATKKIQQVQQAKSLADEVLNIVSSKSPGEKLTDAEVAKIKEFQKQVTDINGKVKQFLPDKATQAKKVIEEVSKIPPENRTIDDLRNYWDARAERARRKLAAQRKIGLLPNTENPVLLYAELGVAKLAKGALNLADFTDKMVQDVGEKVRPVINQVYNQSLNMFRKSQGLPTTNELNQVVNRAVKDRELDAETAAQFKNWANQIVFYTDENLRTEALQDLQLALRKLDKSTLGQKISSLQAGAQLLSLPTTIRNVIGNEAFSLLEKANKVAAIPIDWTVSKFTGERAIIFNPQNQEKYWSNWFKGAQGGWKGVSPNGKLTAYDIRPEVFGERNPLKYITKLTGAELQSFDHAAYMRAYGDVLATYAEQLGKSQGMNGKALKEAIPSLIKQFDQSIYDMADEAGRYATFQDDTVLSKAAEAIKRGLNYPTKLVGDALVKAGMPESWNPSGFGLGDIVLKYAKTPANIIMRAVDYSPIGIFRGIMQMMPLLTKREYNQRQAVLALSRGITGTLGLTGLGYYLASQGILTGAQSSDKDVKALQDAAGQKGYQVNLTALQRWIMSGLDKNAAKYQNGDRLINYDWLQPMAISLAMGVNANQAVQQKKAGVSKSNIDIARDAMVGGLKTVMQQPLVQGLQQLADATGNLMKYGSWSGFANIMKGIPASFVPAFSGQVRNFTDNTARSTYDPSVLKSMVNMVINKIPGLAKQLSPQIDSLSGQPKSVVDGGQAGTLSQGLNVFLNPAKMSQYNVSPEAEMIVQLINDTGDTRVAPRVPNRYLMVDKKKVNLTPGQYLQLQQSTSQFTAQQLKRMTPMLTNQNVPEKRKIDAVISVLNAAGDRARKEIERDYPELRTKKAAR